MIRNKRPYSADKFSNTTLHNSLENQAKKKRRTQSMPSLQVGLSESSNPEKQDHLPKFCPISQETTATVSTPCNHFFNLEKLRKWIKTETFESNPMCPTCKTPINTMKRLSCNMLLKIVDYSKYDLNNNGIFEKFKNKLVEDRNKFLLDFLNTSKNLITISDQFQNLDQQLSEEKLSECENILGTCYMKHLEYARKNQQEIFSH